MSVNVVVQWVWNTKFIKFSFLFSQSLIFPFYFFFQIPGFFSILIEGDCDLPCFTSILVPEFWLQFTSKFPSLFPQTLALSYFQTLTLVSLNPKFVLQKNWNTRLEPKKTLKIIRKLSSLLFTSSPSIKIKTLTLRCNFCRLPSPVARATINTRYHKHRQWSPLQPTVIVASPSSILSLSHQQHLLHSSSLSITTSATPPPFADVVDRSKLNRKHQIFFLASPTHQTISPPRFIFIIFIDQSFSHCHCRQSLP